MVKVSPVATSLLGLTAAAHLACARPNIAFVDLDSALNQQINPVVGGIIYDVANGGLITLPDEPGLGTRIRDEVLQTCEHYAVADSA